MCFVHLTFATLSKTFAPSIKVSLLQRILSYLVALVLSPPTRPPPSHANFKLNCHSQKGLGHDTTRIRHGACQCHVFANLKFHPISDVSRSCFRSGSPLLDDSMFQISQFSPHTFIYVRSIFVCSFVSYPCLFHTISSFLIFHSILFSLLAEKSLQSTLTLLVSNQIIPFHSIPYFYIPFRFVVGETFFYVPLMETYWDAVTRGSA